MKNILVRSLSGLFFIVLVLGSELFSSFSSYILFLFVLIFGLREFYRFGRYQENHPNMPIGIVTGIVIYTLSYLIAGNVLPLKAYILVIPFIIFIPILELYRQKSQPINNIGITFLGLVYVVLPVSLMHFMVLSKHAIAEEPDWISQISNILWNKTDSELIYFNAFIIIGYFIIQWVSDTGAFVFGISFGKHRLFERISPKKSWEGAIGGLLATIGAAYFVHYLYPSLALLHWIAISIIITVFGIFGDLIESLYKRSVSVKDSGKIMPGHGGILDRFDSSLLALPMVYFYLQIIYYF
ncbi:MAG: phosphatidate cytidylyltransferase [Bacteroidales bacterium]|nr:phosphatidate cytidylyltransferase [Bacteroidales bacterium]